MMKQSVYLMSVGLTLVACSGSSNDTSGGTGGIRNGSGGAPASGGASSSGGSPSTGGNAALGGAVATGGSTGSGGASAGGSNSGGANTGGGMSLGGANAGGSNSGGANAGGSNSGGASTGGAGTGGKSTGGANSGGASTGGAKSTGGSSSGGAGTGGGTASGDCVSTPVSQMVGWATQGGGTTGGSGTPVVATTLAQLNGYLDENATPQIIHVRGVIEGQVTLDGTANKTIIGCGATLRGGIMMEESSNIIIQNLKIVATNPDSGGDLITLDNQSHHVWLDHLDLSDGADGGMDIVHGSDYVTVSWTKFSYTAIPASSGGDSAPGGHQFATLIGHSNDNAAEDTGRLRITFHHNFWGNNVKERMPRVRFGQVHLLNNLMASSGGYETTYAVRAGVSANIRSEGNVFNAIANPFDFGESNEAARLESIGDLFTACTGTMTPRGPAFTPPYTYTAEPTAGLEAKIRAGAGVR